MHSERTMSFAKCLQRTSFQDAYKAGEATDGFNENYLIAKFSGAFFSNFTCAGTSTYLQK